MKLKFLNRRLLLANFVTAVFITVSVAAFATLGDGDKDKGKKTIKRSLLSNQVYHPYSFKTFSLRSGYQYRGSSILSNASQNKFILVNTVVTYEKGNTTYILPMKRKVILDKIKFNPAQ